MRKWLPLTAVCLGTFVLLLDVTIVNVALPSMATSLSASFADLQWVVDGYALALAALLMLAGAIADRAGRRATFVVGLVVFAAASLACGAAPSSSVLVASRVVQGVGGAAMFAATTALLSTSYSGRDRGTAFGVWGAVSGAAAAAGPLAGGVLVDALSWRWVFFVNLPVAAVAVVLALRTLPETRHPAGRLDVGGAVAFTLAAASLVFGLIRGGEHGWTSAGAVASVGVSALAVVVFCVVERRASAPLLDLRLLRSPSFSGLLVVAVLMQASAFGTLAYASLWLQSLLGLDAVRAGLVVLPLSVVAFVVSAAVGRLLHDRSPWLPVTVGMALIGAGDLLVVLALHVWSPVGWMALVPGMVVGGLGVGLGTPVLVSAALATVPHHRAGMASGAVNTARQLGMALGIAVLGSVLSAAVRSSVSGAAGVPQPERFAAGLTSGGAQQLLAAVPSGARAVAESLAQEAFAAGLDRVFLVAGVAGLVGALVSLVALRPRLTDDAVISREAVTSH
ncbi:drug resistance transporter, EmrB/QacA subfamily [Quadrisphaera granulorum]|uniref:EmrB/QacA subfamily drug resistance transporter n=1 Tax=Quadrisphaera granulorum TaxID=317664 RepID=A0A316A8R5_9ACTN|nr:DHA2 family efflux MFS transporter permease subunit [Quadrisphaera granulorum]PWJ53598.1 EmrB/QacA subfamily drug resistance transporter [Quadrisphaera granulorum]SZE96642.1 drug resistance transporter, EmrB/QacA subfamily [Quadrisphaera granulorum]